MSDEIYLDYAATAPMRREVLEAMFPFFQQKFGNPSSVHSRGSEASAALERARHEIAAVLECSDDEIVFTSGGTESDNLALRGVASGARHNGDHIVISAIEHEAVLNTAVDLRSIGYAVDLVPVDGFGLVDPERLASLVRPDTILVSCMYANNEIGTVEPIAELSRAVRQCNPRVVFHTDAVQAAGSLDLSVDRLAVDLMSISAHKIGGPRGVGALFVRAAVDVTPMLSGGGQESGRRSGTENVAGAVGLATALKLAQDERGEERARLLPLRNKLIRAVVDSGEATLTGHSTLRLPGHGSFGLRDRSAESVLVDLDVRGVQCSSGSACHAGQTDPSHVLLAIGLDSIQAKNGLRMTIGHGTTAQDIDYAVTAIGEVLKEPAMVGR